MAEKKELTVAGAKVVAAIKAHPRFNGKWGANEHASAIRMLVKDFILEAPTRMPKLQAAEDAKAVVEKRQPVKLDMAATVSRLMAAEFAVWPSWTIASNFYKELVAAGELVAPEKGVRADYDAE